MRKRCEVAERAKKLIPEFLTESWLVVKIKEKNNIRFEISLMGKETNISIFWNIRPPSTQM